MTARPKQGHEEHEASTAGDSLSQGGTGLGGASHHCGCRPGLQHPVHRTTLDGGLGLLAHRVVDTRCVPPLLVQTGSSTPGTSHHSWAVALASASRVLNTRCMHHSGTVALASRQKVFITQVHPPNAGRWLWPPGSPGPQHPGHHITAGRWLWPPGRPGRYHPAQASAASRPPPAPRTGAARAPLREREPW